MHLSALLLSPAQTLHAPTPALGITGHNNNTRRPLLWKKRRDEPDHTDNVMEGPLHIVASLGTALHVADPELLGQVLGLRAGHLKYSKCPLIFCSVRQERTSVCHEIRQL